MHDFFFFFVSNRRPSKYQDVWGSFLEILRNDKLHL